MAETRKERRKIILEEVIKDWQASLNNYLQTLPIIHNIETGDVAAALAVANDEEVEHAVTVGAAA